MKKARDPSKFQVQYILVVMSTSFVFLGLI